MVRLSLPLQNFRLVASRGGWRWGGWVGGVGSLCDEQHPSPPFLRLQLRGHFRMGILGSLLPIDLPLNSCHLPSYSFNLHDRLGWEALFYRWGNWGLRCAAMWLQHDRAGTRLSYTTLSPFTFDVLGTFALEVAMQLSWVVLGRDPIYFSSYGEAGGGDMSLLMPQCILRVSHLERGA